MGRIRSVKPGLFTDSKLFDAEQETQLPLRLAYIGLWTQCDREGRFTWIPKELGIAILPYDNLDFSRVLDALATRGFIVKYHVNNVWYGYVRTWKVHQFVNGKEPKSNIPKHTENQQLNTFVTCEPRDNDVSVTDGVKEGKGKEGKGTIITRDEHAPDSDQKLAMIAMLHPKLSHLTERELPMNVLSGIIDAIAGERERQGITEADALKYLFDETRRVVLAASKTGQDRFLKSPADFWKPGIAQYRRPNSDFVSPNQPPPQPKIKVSPPGTNSLANQVEALRRAEEAKKAPQTQTQ